VGDVGVLGDGELQWLRCRLKFRMLLEDDRGGKFDDRRVGEIADMMVVKLFDLPLEGGVMGLVVTVHMLLLRVLLPVEDDAEELLVPEPIFRSLLKAPRLLKGGLEVTTIGA